MVEVFHGELVQQILSVFPKEIRTFVGLFLLILIVVAYAVFIWKFYRFIARKNLINLNLKQYNHSNHPFFEKLISGALYLLEYVIILPFLIFFWFTFFTLFLMLLTQNLETQFIFLVSATIIGAVRMVSYYSEDLARDLAKLLPLTLLALAITNPSGFNLVTVSSHLSNIPQFLNEIGIYLIFIILLEVVLRTFDFIFTLFGLEEETIEED